MPIPIGALDPTLPDPEPIPISTTTPDSGGSSGGSSGGNDYDIPNTKTYLELEAAKAAEEQAATDKAAADKALKAKLTAEAKAKKIKLNSQRQAEEIAAISSQFGFVPPGVDETPEQANFSRNIPKAPGGIPTILGRMDDEKAPVDAWEGLLQALLEQKRRSVM